MAMGQCGGLSARVHTSPHMSCSCLTASLSATAMSSSLLRSQRHFLPLKSTTCCGRPHYRPRQNDDSLSPRLFPLSPVEPFPSCLCHVEWISCKVIGVDWPEPVVNRRRPQASVIVFQGNDCSLPIAEALSRQLSARGILVKDGPLSMAVLKDGH
jgi:hypothetical protein